MRANPPQVAIGLEPQRKALKRTFPSWSRGRKLSAVAGRKKQEGKSFRRGSRAAAEENPLKGESQTWLWGEINPQGLGGRNPSKE